MRLAFFVYYKILATVDQLVCRAPGTLPAQVRSLVRENLLAEGGVVYPCVKKHLLACPTSKHRSKAGPVSHGLRCRCVQVGQGFGNFLDLCKEVFFLQHYAVGAFLPPQVEFFFIKSEKKQSTIPH